jgi:solute carrier family 25, member 42
MDLIHTLEEIRCLLQKQEVVSRLICGAVAGSVAKTVVAPAERVKMHFQINKDPFSMNAALLRAKMMIRHEGIRSLWNGHSTTLVRVAPYAGLQFAVHDHMESAFQILLETERLPTFYKFAAGAIAGSVATLLTYPLDVLRVRIALTPGATWRSSIQKGGLFSGLTPTIVGIIPYSGTAWCVKSTLHQQYKELNGYRPDFYSAIVLNGLAGLAGQFVTYPLDVVRRRMQMAEGETTVTCLLKDIWATEGPRGLLKGFTMNLFKGPITISVSMTTYDMLMRWINDNDNN